jgi:hypothetical protein
VAGSFVAIVGDFDGDDADEIVYYAPGPGDDLLVNFASATGQHCELVVQQAGAPPVGNRPRTPKGRRGPSLDPRRPAGAWVQA